MSRTLNRVPAVRIRQSPPRKELTHQTSGGSYFYTALLGQKTRHRPPSERMAYFMAIGDSDRPVLTAQAPTAAEFPQVVADSYGAQCQRISSNHQIQTANRCL